MREFILSDAARGVHVDSFRLDAAAMGHAAPAPWSVTKRTLRGGRREGVELIEIVSGDLTSPDFRMRDVVPPDDVSGRRLEQRLGLADRLDERNRIEERRTKRTGLADANFRSAARFVADPASAAPSGGR